MIELLGYNLTLKIIQRGDDVEAVFIIYAILLLLTIRLFNQQYMFRFKVNINTRRY